MYKIEKSFDFDYAHRVWNQELLEEFSCDKELKCRHLHGHHGVVTIHLEASELDGGSMVTDFKHLNWFKEFLSEKLDHKTIIDKEDPFIKDYFSEISNIDIENDKFTFIFPPTETSTSLGREILGSFVFTDCIPTSENLSRILCKLVSKKMENFLNINKITVTFSETPQSKASYTICLK